MTAIIIHAFFEDSTNLDGETGLSPTVDVRSIAKADLTNTLEVNDQAMTEIGGGLYAYRYASGTPKTHDYVAVAKTTSGDVVSKQVPALRWDAAEAWDTELDRLDAAISTRATSAEVVTTLAVSATEAATVAANQVAVSQAYTTAIAITSTLTADLSAASKVWFAVKRSLDKDQTADTDSIILIEDTAGLTYLNEAAYATSAHGTLVVSGSSGAWVITVTIQEDATKLIDEAFFGTYPMELKAIVSSDTQYISGGTAVISKRLIQSIS